MECHSIARFITLIIWCLLRLTNGKFYLLQPSGYSNRVSLQMPIMLLPAPFFLNNSFHCRKPRLLCQGRCRRQWCGTLTMMAKAIRTALSIPGCSVTMRHRRAGRLIWLLHCKNNVIQNRGGAFLAAPFLFIRVQEEKNRCKATLPLSVRNMSIFLRKSSLAVVIAICLLSFWGCNKNPTKPTLASILSTIVMKGMPAGTFTMGSDSAVDSAQPAHQVTLSAFKMSETEVTQEQYLAVMDTNPSYWNTGSARRPVESVSWFNAVLFCNTLSKLSGLDTVYDTTTWAADFTKSGYRLPTEA